RRRTARVEETCLHEQDERAGGHVAAGHDVLSSRALLERSAALDGPRPRDLGRAPRDRSVEGPVELEHTRSVAIAAELRRVTLRQTPPGHPQELAWGHVEQSRRPSSKLVD